MKPDIHPKYYPKAKVKCACGAIFEVGSTKPELYIEICSKCHPFYTGKEKIIDTAGKVEKFKARKAKAQAALKKPSKKTKRAAAKKAKAKKKRKS
jgi:large subunit ribosomal protein L31